MQAKIIPEFDRTDVVFLNGNGLQRRRLANGAVKQQTQDVLNAIKLAHSLPGLAPTHTILVEDDFMLCSNGLLALYYFIVKIARYTDNKWLDFLHTDCN